MARQLEIIIYGLACFDEQPNGDYRVLLPDGRRSGPFRIPPHGAAVWVRGRNAVAQAQWRWQAERNDFTFGEPSKLIITGLKKSRLEKKDFVGRLANLRDSDPNFTIAPDPEAIVDFTIDRGTLSAHKFPTGMRMVKWQVESANGTPIRFEVGNAWIEIPERATQVTIANVGIAGANEPPRGDSHFLLFRKLSTDKLTQLHPTPPKQEAQLLGVTLHEPSHRYMVARTPRVDCSGVFAH